MGKPMHIMIVDDDADDVEFLITVFRGRFPTASFTVFDRGEPALEYLLCLPPDATCPDLAFLDLHMPGKNGYQILTELRGSARCSRLPVLILSTSLQASEADRCRDAGCDGYFSKPMSLSGYDDIVLAGSEFLTTNEQ